MPMLSCFLKRVAVSGIPSRARSDEGEKNVLVADYILEKGGSERVSMTNGQAPATNELTTIGEMSLVRLLHFVMSCLLLWKTTNY